MEPQGRGTVPTRHTPERPKPLGLTKTTLESREGTIKQVGLTAREKKRFGTEPKGGDISLDIPFYWTSPNAPLYIHVEKDFQSHHMPIYSSTLMGGQEREKKCVRNA